MEKNEKVLNLGKTFKGTYVALTSTAILLGLGFVGGTTVKADEPVADKAMTTAVVTDTVAPVNAQAATTEEKEDVVDPVMTDEKNTATDSATEDEKAEVPVAEQVTDDAQQDTATSTEATAPEATEKVSAPAATEEAATDAESTESAASTTATADTVTNPATDVNAEAPTNEVSTAAATTTTNTGEDPTTPDADAGDTTEAPATSETTPPTYTQIDPEKQTLAEVLENYYAEYEANHPIAKGEVDPVADMNDIFYGSGEIDETYWIDTDTKVPINSKTLSQGHVTDAWKAGYKGEGMVVAVIDSGMETHKDMRLSNPESAEAQGNIANAKAFIAEKGYGTYINEKIPFSYNYVSNDSDDSTTNSSDHGMHVAGIIAANGDATEAEATTTSYVTGVAPEAQVLNMKVFGSSDEAPTAAYIAKAIYDAVDLGANVINMSLGSTWSNDTEYDHIAQAVAYAKDHGTVVVVSAGNSASRAKVGSTNAENFSPINGEAITNPGALTDVITVAASAANSITVFSSFGPNSDFTLKPDVAAPGSGVMSTMFLDSYQSMTGSSMSAPYVAGMAAVTMQYLKKTTDFSGADLVDAVKLAIMNSTSGQYTASAVYKAEDGTKTKESYYMNNLFQGSGFADLSGVVTTSVSAESVDANGEGSGVGSVSLKGVGKETDFEVLLTNYGENDVDYTFDNGLGAVAVAYTSNGGMTPNPLPGVTVTTDTPTLTLKAGEAKKVQLHLLIDESVQPKTDKQKAITLNTIINGFIFFKNATGDGNNDLVLPYLAYYGDLTNQDVFNAEVLNRKNYLESESEIPLGLGSNAEGVAVVVANGAKNFADGGYEDADILGAAKHVDTNKVAISPNNDGDNDSAIPVVYLVDNLKSMKIEILDENGNVVRVVDQEENLEASGPNYYMVDNDATPMIDSHSIEFHPEDLAWDGLVYDQTTGKMVVAADGQYTFRVTGTLNYEGENKEQVLDFALKVDTKHPEIKSAGFDAAENTVTVQYDDQGVGFTENSLAIFTIGGVDYQVALGNDGNSSKGTFNAALTDAELAALTASDGNITVAIHDAAGNDASQTIETGITASGELPDAEEMNAPTFNFYYKAPLELRTNALKIIGYGFTIDADVIPTQSTFVDEAILKAKVSGVAGTQYFVRDLMTNQIFTPESFDDEGNAIFRITGFVDGKNNVDGFSGSVIQGYAISPTGKAGVFKQSLIDGMYITYIKTTDVSLSTALDLSDAPFVSPFADPQAILDALVKYPERATTFGFNVAEDDGYKLSHFTKTGIGALNDKIKNQVKEKGHLIDINHTGAESSYTIPGSEEDYYTPDQDVLTVNTANLGGNVFINTMSDNAAYDRVTGTYSIEGHVELNHSNLENSDITGVTLYILGNSTQQADPKNKVEIDENGNFTYSISLAENTNRGFAYSLLYQLKNIDGTFGEVRVKSGSMNIINDLVVPTIETDLFDGAKKLDDENYEISTYEDNFNILAVATDNSNGYKVAFNGDQIFRQADAYTDTLLIGNDNPDYPDEASYQFGDYDINQNVNLLDGDNYVVMEVVDTIGNVTKRVLKINKMVATTTVADSVNMSTLASEKAQAAYVVKALAQAEAINKANAAAAAAKAEAEAKAEADAKAKAEADEKAKAEADEKAKAEADAKAKAEADAKAKAEADAKAKAEADEKAKAEVNAKAKAEADEKAKADADEKAKAEADEKAKAEVDQKAKAEADEKAKVEADEKVKADADTVEKAKTQATTTAKNNQTTIVLSDGTVIDTPAAVTTTDNQAATTKADSNAAEDDTLPQTSDNNNVVLSLLGVVLGGFGVVFGLKKKQI